MTIKPLARNKTLTDRAYDRLKGLILNSQLVPGQSVTETWLSESLGVSRTPVRHAVSRLISEGLMTADGGRIQVRRVTAREAEDVADVRLVVEGYTVRRLAQKGLSDEALESLNGLIAELAGLVDNSGECQDTESFMITNREFHRQLAECTGNTILVDFTESILDLVVLSGLTALHIPQRAGAVVQEHAAILAAIEARDEELAYEAMRLHAKGVGVNELLGMSTDDEN